MPTYQTPGVYVEEFEIGAKPIEGVATSTAGFLGETERGSTEPLLVTSYPDYLRKFGGVFKVDGYMPYAVQGFFENGGSVCYVARIVKVTGDEPAVSASVSLDPLVVSAIGEGEWGNRLFVSISNASSRDKDEVDPTGPFRLRVYYWSEAEEDIEPFDPEGVIEGDPTDSGPPVLIEDFDELSADPKSPDYFDKRINHGNSALIHIALPETATSARPGNAVLTPLINGVGGGPDEDIEFGDFGGRNTAGERTGLAALNESRFEEIAILYAPNALSVDGLPGAMISHCEINKYRFAVFESIQNRANVTTVVGDKPGDSKYAAYYYPWIRVIDPDTGARKQIPPGGHIAGIYARSDTERGVWKAPANEIVRGAVELEYKLTDADQSQLNPKGVNAIRAFPNRGRRVWGARTVSSDALWKYVNVRRLFIFLEASIFRGTQWVVFEPNDPKLWARVNQTITGFLRTQWREGALFGRTEEDAFFVKVDESTMSPDDIANGRLIIQIGVAPVRPAEFVIFRIAQLTGSAAEAT